jgi:predicted ester cyclase
MSSEENKATIRRFVEKVWNGHDHAAVGEFHADSFTMNGEPQKAQDFADALEGYFEFCPDLHEDIEVMVAEGDRVTYRWVMRGTDPRTHGEFVVRGMSMSRMADGKIVEEWYYNDQSVEDVQGIVDWVLARRAQHG